MLFENVWGKILIIDFDTNDWIPSLEEALGELVCTDLKTRIKAATFQYKEDALSVLVENAGLNNLVDVTLNWIASNSVRAFHGTRLSDAEVENVEKNGLKPLNFQNRIQRLRETDKALAVVLTPEFIQAAIDKGQMENRRNQVHLAVSKAEMFRGYDYAEAGSEFDRRILEWGGRGDLVPHLLAHGKSRLVKVVLPGPLALSGLHAIYPVEMATQMNEGWPYLVRDLLMEYAWNLYEPHRPRDSADICMIFKETIQPVYIEDIETI